MFIFSLSFYAIAISLFYISIKKEKDNKLSSLFSHKYGWLTEMLISKL